MCVYIYIYIYMYNRVGLSPLEIPAGLAPVGRRFGALTRGDEIMDIATPLQSVIHQVGDSRPPPLPQSPPFDSSRPLGS